MKVFDHLVKYLAEKKAENNDAISITEEQLNKCLKEYSFAKLKDQTLGCYFNEKFKISDHVLSIITSEKETIQYIRHSYLR